jgi:hypothetical protein
LWGRTVWWSDPVEVLRTWREYGQALGKERPISQHGRAEPNSDRREGATPRDSDFNDVFARRVLQRVAEISLVDGGIPELDKEFVWEEVHEEVRRLDGGKAADLDGIFPELLKKAGKAYCITVARGLAEGLFHAPAQRGWVEVGPG